MGRRGRGLSRIGSFFDAFNESYDTVGRVMTDAKLQKIAQEAPEEMAPVDTVDFAPPDSATGGAEGGPVVGLKRMEAPKQYRFLGKTYDKPLSEGDVEAKRNSAMADAIAANDPVKAQQLRQAGLQAQAAGIQVDNARRDQEWRAKSADVVSEFDKTLTDEKGQKRQPTTAESYDLAVRLASVNQAYGHGNIYDRAEALDRAKKARDEGYVEAIRYAHAGDKEGAIKAFNQFGDIKIKDLALTPTMMNVGGVKVPTYAISGTTADGKPIQIPNAYGALLRGLTFDHVAKGEEMGLKRLSTNADVTRANAAADQVKQGKRQLVQDEQGTYVVDMGKGDKAPGLTRLDGIGGKPNPDKVQHVAVKGVTGDTEGVMTFRGERPVGYAKPGEIKASAPAAAIDALRKQPDLAAQFDAKYGAGSAARALGGR